MQDVPDGVNICAVWEAELAANVVQDRVDGVIVPVVVCQGGNECRSDVLDVIGAVPCFRTVFVEAEGLAKSGKSVDSAEDLSSAQHGQDSFDELLAFGRMREDMQPAANLGVLDFA